MLKWPLQNLLTLFWNFENIAEPILYEDYNRKLLQENTSTARGQTLRPPQPLPPTQHPRIPPPRPSDGPLISFDDQGDLTTSKVEK